MSSEADGSGKRDRKRYWKRFQFLLLFILHCPPCIFKLIFHESDDFGEVSKSGHVILVNATNLYADFFRSNFHNTGDC